ncbi:DUF397 domain-containing protein [Actinomadura fibrosa]|uniref:DUF397 domain-containing protein n=1 Tax=Actinomadura fibrosa TaxID=111802 RepID=A0ABW2XJ86_9ACTN|nr:DUF397 domain-containing protein [Actinomadura fibrosa]
MASTSAVQWRKSSRSDNTGGQCVEVAELAPGVGVRDSKDPAGAVLRFSAAEWRHFAASVRSGRFDLS